MKNPNLYPFIFTKKVNNDYKLVPFNTTYNEVGVNKYFPAVSKEWKNTVYHYNSKKTVNFPVYDLNVNSLIKGYFSLYFKSEILKSKYISQKKKHKSLNRIFVSKAEIKHTNNKAIITIYIFNRERLVLRKKIWKMKSYLKNLFSFWWKLYNTTYDFSMEKFIELQNELGSELGDELIEKLQFYFSSIKRRISSFKAAFLKRKSQNSRKNSSKYIPRNYNRNYKKNITRNLFQSKYSSRIHQKNEDLQIIDIRKKILNTILTARRLKLKIQLNKHKLENKFLFRLSGLISKYYNKKVEFNIVNLKSLANNNDIFTQVLTLKLKKEKSSPIKRMNSLLARVVLPKVNSIIERGRIEKQVDFSLIPNKYQNLNISDIISERSKYWNEVSKDSLQNLLVKNDPIIKIVKNKILQAHLDYNKIILSIDNDIIKYEKRVELYKSKIKTTTAENKEYVKKINKLNVKIINLKFKKFMVEKPKNLKIRGLIEYNSIIDSIKYKKMAGAKLIVKGRLTRRYRADRALYKYKWKGGLKNIDSAFKGLSTVVFRGYMDSNVEKSIYWSKRRIGSFGVRSWLAGK